MPLFAHCYGDDEDVVPTNGTFIGTSTPSLDIIARLLTARRILIATRGFLRYNPFRRSRYHTYRSLNGVRSVFLILTMGVVNPFERISYLIFLSHFPVLFGF
jgi:hypothetical protein